MDDPARIKQILQTAAVLELYEVKDGPFCDRGRSPREARRHSASQHEADQGRGSGRLEHWVAAGHAYARGSRLRSSGCQTDPEPDGSWETQFVLTQEAGKRFERYTEANVGNRLAIVLDNQWRLAPTINSKIGDTGTITNMGGQQDASDTALVLRAGSLPASLVYLQESTVGPSLGADSIRQGFIAGIVGIGAVVLVMLLYYKRAGINATLALILNALILIAALAYFGAVLTLPGIAGCDPDDRYGGRQQRADLRAYSRRVAARQGGRCCDRDRIRQSFRHDPRYARHHGGVLFVPVLVRNRSGEGVCRDAGDRLDRQRVHGGVCVEVYLRLGNLRQAPAYDPEYIVAMSALASRYEVPESRLI